MEKASRLLKSQSAVGCSVDGRLELEFECFVKSRLFSVAAGSASHVVGCSTQLTLVVRNFKCFHFSNFFPSGSQRFASISICCSS